MSEATTGGVLYKNVFLKSSQNSQENTCARVCFLIKLQASACNFIKKETPPQVFSCEFCEVFRNIFFTEHLRRLLSEYLRRDYSLIGHSPNFKSSIFSQTKKKETKIQKIKKILPF